MAGPAALGGVLAGAESFDSSLSVFLATFAGLYFWMGDWALGSIFTHFWHFSNISEFNKVLSLKSFGSSWGKSYSMFLH